MTELVNNGYAYVSSSTDKWVAAIRGKDNGRCHRWFKKGVKVDKALNIKHVDLYFHYIWISNSGRTADADLVNEYHTGYNFGYSLLHVAFLNFVDFSSKLVGDFCTTDFP